MRAKAIYAGLMFNRDHADREGYEVVADLL